MEFKNFKELCDHVQQMVGSDVLYDVKLMDITLDRDNGNYFANTPAGRYRLHSIPETLDTFFERSGQTMEANKRLSISSQIEIMNDYCFPSFSSDAKGLLLIRDGKLLALHSNRYGYINQSTAIRSFLDALSAHTTDFSFVEGSYTHSMTRLVVRVKSDELMKDYILSAEKAGLPPLVGKGAYITLEFRTNDVGTCEVGVIPKLNVAGHGIYLDEPFQRKHKDISTHRACGQIYKGTEDLFFTAKEEVKLIGTLMNIKISDAKKTVDKCIKYLKLKKLSVLGVEQFLETANYDNVRNAFQVYVLMHDFLKTDAIRNSNKEYQERCSRNLRKLVKADWTKLQ